MDQALKVNVQWLMDENHHSEIFSCCRVEFHQIQTQSFRSVTNGQKVSSLTTHIPSHMQGMSVHLRCCPIAMLQCIYVLLLQCVRRLTIQMKRMMTQTPEWCTPRAMGSAVDCRTLAVTSCCLRPWTRYSPLPLELLVLLMKNQDGIVCLFKQ